MSKSVSDTLEEIKIRLGKLHRGDIIPCREWKKDKGHFTVKIGLKEKQPDGSFKWME